MKKNLKKVISAVLALTLAMSSFVALATTTSAATFTDVKETASYAEAVNALAALGVFTGYGDGTFQPDNKITRAEVITMIVNANAMAENAANSSSTTKFADVNSQASWAAGFVNVGVAEGFISGMSATEFGPSLNVNYAMVLTMLTKMLGYNEYALSRGGYPDGYMESARMAEIMTGVSAAETEELTRAQVAQLIWNAVRAPKVDATKLSTNANTGNELEKMDGKNGNPFVTVLSDKFDAYVLNVEVTGTSKMNTSLELGEVKLQITGNNDYDPEFEGLFKDLKDAQKAPKTVDSGKTDAENYAFSSAKVVVNYNEEDNEWTLIYFAPTSKVATKNVDGTLFKSSENDFNTTDGKVLSIKKSEISSSTTKYKLTNNAKLYVNGVEYLDVNNTNKTAIENILAASVGDTVLYENKTESKYDKIMVNVYALASVSQVKTSGDDVTVIFSSTKAPATGVGAPSTKFVIDADDVEDGKLVVNIQKNGSEVDATSLVKNDVVAIKYDINGALDASRTVEMLVTDEKVTGQYSSKLETGEYVISGTEYKLANGVSEASLGLNAADARGKTYTFRLDPFGNLYSGEVEASTTMYAIVERYWNVAQNGSASGVTGDYIEIVTLDGKRDTLVIDDNYETSATTVMKAMGLADVNGKGYTQAQVAAAKAIEDRVISYTVKSTGKVNKIVDETGNVQTFTGAKYNEQANTLDKRITTDATVLDATKYDTAKPSSSQYATSSLANLVGTVTYDGFLVHKNSQAAYAYVVITNAGQIYGPTTGFAVAAVDASLSSGAIVNEEDVYTLRVADVEGTEGTTILNIAQDAEVFYYDGGYVTTNNAYAADAKYSKIKEGTAFFYTTDSDGFVDRIDIVLKGNYTFDDILATTFETNNVFLPENTVDGKTILDDDWRIGRDVTWGSNGDNEIQLFVAPVVYATDSSVTFGVMGTNYVDTNDTETFSVTSNSKIYAYDLEEDDLHYSEAFGFGSFNGLDVAEAEEDGKAWFSTLAADAVTNAGASHDFDGQIQMAYVMAVGGVVTNAIVFSN